MRSWGGGGWRSWGPAVVAAVVVMVVPLAVGAVAYSNERTSDRARQADTFEIVMVTFRGCEEACEGFHDYVATNIPGATVRVLDVDRDRDRIPGFIEEVRESRPDLLVTWGTSVTTEMIGTVGDTDGKITDIPTVFMIVADPLGAGVVESYERSGRPTVAGTLNRVPELTQVRALADYRSFDTIGLVYNDTELNAVLKVEEMREAAISEGFDLVERVIENDADGEPRVDDIGPAVADIAAEGVDFLYVGSSSFLLANADVFTKAALDHGLPVATAYEAMVREADGLIALASAYYNVGQLAGFQAEQILVNGIAPGDLEVLGLNRFTVLINIDTAHALGLYPPMLMLRYAEIVGAAVDSDAG